MQFVLFHVIGIIIGNKRKNASSSLVSPGALNLSELSRCNQAVPQLQDISRCSI